MRTQLARRVRRGVYQSPTALWEWDAFGATPITSPTSTVVGSMALLTFLAVLFAGFRLLHQPSVLEYALALATSCVAAAAVFQARRLVAASVTVGGRWSRLGRALWAAACRGATLAQHGLRLALDYAVRGFGPEASERRLVPERVRNYVLDRSHDRCQVPGCGAGGRMRMDLHVMEGSPVEARAGTVLVLCRQHHLLAHQGQITQRDLATFLHPRRVFDGVRTAQARPWAWAGPVPARSTAMAVRTPVTVRPVTRSTPPTVRTGADD